MKTRVLVCGFGFMGQTHAHSLLKMNHVDLVGLVDPCEPLERLRTIQGNQATEVATPEEIQGIPHYCTLDAAIQAAHADVAVIALPTKLHHAAVVQCLDAGLHVFVEKPFAISLKECDDMLQAAERNQRLLAVGYVVRFMKEYQFLKNTMDTGRLGKLKYMKLSRITGVPKWGNWSDPAFIRTSGGSLFDLVSHDVDFARFCLGEPEDVEATEGLGGEQFKMISATLWYHDLAVLLEGGMVTPANYPFERAYTAYFEKGTLCSKMGGIVTEYSGDMVQQHDFLPDNPYFTELELFMQAVESGEQSLICTGKDARGTIASCIRIAETIHYPLLDLNMEEAR